MRVSSTLYRNLNKIHWDRRAWQIGYRGPPLPQQKATGRPHRPIHRGSVELLRSNLAREYNVMRHLANPYLNEEAEAPYVQQFGNVKEVVEKEIELKKQTRMPGDVKQVTNNTVPKLYGNYGNLLHKHRTVEDSLFQLVRRERWD
uniref:Uncharacterized protein n=1 Tax=Panagrellus redivivus TaxID=6233 RepID=A0A7E4ZWM1_PANRE